MYSLVVIEFSITTVNADEVTIQMNNHFHEERIKRKYRPLYVCLSAIDD